MKRFAAVSAILAILVAGCAGGIIKSKVQSGIRSALPKYLGPAKNYTVKADGSGEAMLSGHIGHLHIEGEDVQMEPKLTVSKLVIDLDDIRFNTHTRKIKSIKGTDFSAVLVQDALNHFVTESTKNKYEIDLKLQPNVINVDFSHSIMGQKSRISVVGKPAIVDGTKVNFIADKASVASLPVPKLIVDKILDRVNPIIDTTQFKLPMKLKEIAISDGSLQISGSAEFNPEVPLTKN